MERDRFQKSNKTKEPAPCLRILLFVLVVEFVLCCVTKYMVLQFGALGPILVFYAPIFIFAYQGRRWARILYYLSDIFLLFIAIYGVMGLYLAYGPNTGHVQLVPIYCLYLVRFFVHLAGNILLWRQKR